jgi:hypothetical protein
MEEVRTLGGKMGWRRAGKVKKGRESQNKGRKKSWGKERKVRQERVKQIITWTEWKREIGNNGL